MSTLVKLFLYILVGIWSVRGVRSGGLGDGELTAPLWGLGAVG